MKAIAALLLAFALLPSGAQAQRMRVLIESVCKWDLQQYCKHVKRRRIRELKKCLAKHESELYPRCQDHYKDAR